MRPPDSWGMTGVAIVLVLLLLWLANGIPLAGRCHDGYVEAGSKLGYRRIEIDGKLVKCP